MKSAAGTTKCECFECTNYAVAEVVGWGWGSGRAGLQVCEGHASEAKADGATVDQYDGIVSEEYEPGVPGRACNGCNMAWPASEPDSAPWHHRSGCSVEVAS